MADLESLKFQIQTDVGVTRTHNEDAVGVVLPQSLGDAVVLVIADGMGGEAAGEVASHTLIEALERELPERERENYIDDMVDIIDDVNQELVEMARSNPDIKGMGSTCVAVAFCDDGMARFVHVGDSRLYMVRGDDFQRLTRDHSRVQMFVDAGVLEPEEAEEHPESNVLTQAVGRMDMTVDDSERRFESWEDTTFLLCSDGLTAMLPDSVIHEAMNRLSVNEMADALIRECNELGAKDNISIGVCRHGEPKNPTSREEFHELLPGWLEEYEERREEQRQKRREALEGSDSNEEWPPSIIAKQDIDGQGLQSRNAGSWKEWSVRAWVGIISILAILVLILGFFVLKSRDPNDGEQPEQPVETREIPSEQPVETREIPSSTKPNH